jgi:hypothetical protein
MDAFLRMSDSERRLICEQAQAMLGLPPVAVEKDFWVCWTLQRLFNLPDWGGRLTFKGGTSLGQHSRDAGGVAAYGSSAGGIGPAP